MRCFGADERWSPEDGKLKSERQNAGTNKCFRPPEGPPEGAPEGPARGTHPACLSVPRPTRSPSRPSPAEARPSPAKAWPGPVTARPRTDFWGPGKLGIGNPKKCGKKYQNPNDIAPPTASVSRCRKSVFHFFDYCHAAHGIFHFFLTFFTLQSDRTEKHANILGPCPIGC